MASKNSYNHKPQWTIIYLLYDNKDNMFIVTVKTCNLSQTVGKNKFCLESDLRPKAGEVPGLWLPPSPRRHLPRTSLCPKAAGVLALCLPPSPGGILSTCYQVKRILIQPSSVGWSLLFFSGFRKECLFPIAIFVCVKDTPLYYLAWPFFLLLLLSSPLGHQSFSCDW